MTLASSSVPGLIIILGSPNDSAGNLSEMGLGRLELGAREYQRLRLEGWKVLLTGGFGEHFNTTSKPNAFYAQQFLLTRGLSQADIVEFAESRNTVDDALQSRPIVERYQSRSLHVISSDFHIARVEYIFRSVFPDCALTFAAAPYLESRERAEQDRLNAHERNELKSLRDRGESIVGGVLSINSWRHSK